MRAKCSALFQHHGQGKDETCGQTDVYRRWSCRCCGAGAADRQLSPSLLQSVNKLPIISHFSCALAVFYFSVKLGRTPVWRHFNPRKKRKEEESDWQTSIIRLRNWAHVRRKAGKTNTKRKGIILGEGKRGSIDSLRAVFKGKPTLLLIFPAVLLIRSD